MSFNNRTLNSVRRCDK